MTDHSRPAANPAMQTFTEVLFEPADNDWAVADELWAILEAMESREKAKQVATKLFARSPGALEMSQNLIREYGDAA